MSISTLLAGVSGEYFVAAELSRRGYIASISLRNTRGIDLLVSTEDGSATFTVQCKTTRANSTHWILSEKSEAFISPTHYYVFVSLGPLESRPVFHIVPSNEVSRRISLQHKAYLSKPAKTGAERKDSTMRKFKDEAGEFKERWDLLPSVETAQPGAEDGLPGSSSR